MKNKIGGGMLFLAGAFLARELIVWLWNKTLDSAISYDYRGLINEFNFIDGLGVALIGIGLFFLTRPEKKSQDNSGYQNLFRLSKNITEKVRGHRSLRWFEREHAIPIIDIANSCVSTLITFEKSGFTVPKYINIKYAEQVAVGTEFYLSHLSEMIAQGHISEAIGSSSDLSEQSEKIASNFDPNQWFLRNH